MKITIIVASNDAETTWNALRLANTCRIYDNDTTVFLLGKGVECTHVSSLAFDIHEQLQIFSETGGKLIGCELCYENRRESMPDLGPLAHCELGSMQALYALIAESDRVLTF